LAKQVSCAALGADQLKAINNKCSFVQDNDVVLAKSLDCRLLTSQEREALGDHCTF